MKTSPQQKSEDFIKVVRKLFVSVHCTHTLYTPDTSSVFTLVVMDSLSPAPSAAAVLELSVLSDGQFGGVGGRQAVADVGGVVALLHLRQRRHQPGVRCVQGADPLLLIGREDGCR